MAIKRYTIGLTWTSKPEYWQEINQLLNNGWECLDIATYSYDGEMSQDWTLYKPDEGKSALGIDTATIPTEYSISAATEEAADSTPAEAGYRIESTVTGYKLYAPSGGFMCHIDSDEIITFEDILNGETESLQAELVAAQQRVAELEARINNLQSRMDSIAELTESALNAPHSGITESKLKAIRLLV